jgi:hypothetical protein
MKYLILVLLLFSLSACRTDHFNMEFRLKDEDLVIYEEKESFKSQYDFLVEKEVFAITDFYTPAFKLLTADQRIELYSKINKELNKDDIILLKNKKYYKYVKQEWIVVLFGPPPARRQIVAGFEDIRYNNKTFHFHHELLVDVTDS